ncbi:hypothetical protein [Sphingomonas sp. UYP23]
MSTTDAWDPREPVRFISKEIDMTLPIGFVAKLMAGIHAGNRAV